MIDRTRIAEEIRPDIEELLRIELQIKKLRHSIKEQLKDLTVRKRTITKRVEGLMTEHRFSKVRGDDGIVTLVTRRVCPKLDSISLVERLTEVLRNEDEAVQITARVFEEMPTQEKYSIRIKPESSASDEELNLQEDAL